MLHITEVLPAGEAADAASSVRAANEIQDGGGGHARSRSSSTSTSAQIKQLEEEGDAIYHEAVGALFAGKPGPARGDQVEGDVRHARARDRQLHGRRAGAAEHLAQERVRRAA